MGSGKNAHPTAQPGQKYHFAPGTILPDYDFNISFLYKNDENCYHEKYFHN